MAKEVTKYQLIPNGNIVSEFRGHFSLFKTKKSSAFIYGGIFIFIAVPVFLAFSPSSSSSSSSSSSTSTSSWFINFFTVNNTSPFNHSLRSPFSSNLTQSSSQRNNASVENFETNTSNSVIPVKPTNHISTTSPQISPVSSNQHESFELTNHTILPTKTNVTINPDNLSSVDLPKLPSQDAQSPGDSKSGDDTVSGAEKKEGKSLVGSLMGCDLYDGEWIRDDSYPLYKPESCTFIDEQFSCKLNGRLDDHYTKLKWKPKGCTLPRFNGRQMLKLLRGKRVVFVGDSLNRNMWESLVCILKNSVKNPKNVHEAHGRHYFQNEASYSFVFKDYNCTVEFFVAPFIVRPWEVKDNSGKIKETLRLDHVIKASEFFKTADVIIFNTGHWWTHEKTSKGEDYYQEGSHVYRKLDVKEAFRRALTTWGRWVDKNIDPRRTHVFFRGYSNTHFHGGQWNSGGQCDSETEPIRNETYLTKYPWKMKVFEQVMKGMKLPISYLNVTRMTDYRKDAHPSIYRKQHPSGEEKKSPLKFQDCSHWCLPGVPDLWNELLYAEMLRRKYQDLQQT